MQLGKMSTFFQLWKASSTQSRDQQDQVELIVAKFNDETCKPFLIKDISASSNFLKPFKTITGIYHKMFLVRNTDESPLLLK